MATSLPNDIRNPNEVNESWLQAEAKSVQDFATCVRCGCPLPIWRCHSVLVLGVPRFCSWECADEMIVDLLAAKARRERVGEQTA